MAEVLEKIENPALLENSALLVHMRPVFEFDDDKFEEFCRLNRDLRMEMNADGDLIIMPPTYGRTGNRNFKLTAQFGAWVERDGTGVGFDSSTGFILPNGAKRSPDVSWVRRERLAALTNEQRQKFLPLCPDFVIELRSATDNLEELQAKMREYIKQGAQLGWLIDPSLRSVHVYKNDGSVEILNEAQTLAGDAVLHNFTLDLHQIWEADF